MQSLTQILAGSYKTWMVCIVDSRDPDILGVPVLRTPISGGGAKALELEFGRVLVGRALFRTLKNQAGSAAIVCGVSEMSASYSRFLVAGLVGPEGPSIQCLRSLGSLGPKNH